MKECDDVSIVPLSYNICGKFWFSLSLEVVARSNLISLRRNDDGPKVFSDLTDPAALFTTTTTLPLFPQTTMSEVPQTDVSRPSALPTANFLQRNQGSQSIVDQNSAEYLDAIEEEWNKKVDAEVDILVDGMVDLVSLASVGSLSAVVVLT